MKAPLLILALLSVFLLGCRQQNKTPDPPTLTISGETIRLATNSPQAKALTIEQVGEEQPAFVPLTGRLVWDEDATVRVFTPFAGIVRKLFVQVNEPVTRGEPLADI